ETAYCAEVLAITYQAMGLLPSGQRPNWYDAGRFWSGDGLSLAAGFRLGGEIPVHIPAGDAAARLETGSPACTPSSSPRTLRRFVRSSPTCWTCRPSTRAAAGSSSRCRLRSWPFIQLTVMGATSFTSCATTSTPPSPSCGPKASRWHATSPTGGGACWRRSACPTARNSLSTSPGTHHRCSPDGNPVGYRRLHFWQASARACQGASTGPVQDQTGNGRSSGTSAGD